jgi:multidrug efflux pump subunit AcrA (membrane-fusion protein)
MAEPHRLEELRIDRSERRRGGESPWGRRLLLLGLSAVLVGGAAWWFFGGAGAVEVDWATVIEPRAGAAGSAAGGRSVLDASGYVVARRQATVSSEITGRLVDVAFEEGTSVAEGQILARLDDANARRALDLAEARVAAATSAVKEIEVRLREAELELGRTRNRRCCAS